MSINNEEQTSQNSKHSEQNSNISTSMDSNLNEDESYNVHIDESSRLNKEQDTSVKININNNSNLNSENKSNLLYGNHINNLHPKYLGKTRAFLYINNYPLIIIGPDCKFLNLYYILDCYSVCVLTTAITIYLLFYIFFFDPNFYIIKVFETLIFFLFLISYLITALINPGIPNREYFSKNFSKNNNKQKSGIVECKKCNILVPKSFNVSHCHDCCVCVMNQDHHCPWTGKCIGKYNICSFYCFLFSLLAYFFMTFITFMMFIVNLQENEFQSKRKKISKF